jgi:hypothetical protein
VEAGVSNRLLVGRDLAAGGFRQDAREDAEQAQDHERARVDWRRKDRREQGARRREAQLDERDDALVDVKLGHALGRVGEIAQDRRDPLLEEDAIGVIARVIDRPPGLRSRSVEINDEPTLGSLGKAHALRMQARRIDAVVFGVILPHIRAVRDLREQLAPERLGGSIENGVEAGLHRLAAVAPEELAKPIGAHAAGGDLGVEVASQAVGQP